MDYDDDPENVMSLKDHFSDYNISDDEDNDIDLDMNDEIPTVGEEFVIDENDEAVPIALSNAGPGERYSNEQSILVPRDYEDDIGSLIGGDVGDYLPNSDDLDDRDSYLARAVIADTSARSAAVCGPGSDENKSCLVRKPVNYSTAGSNTMINSDKSERKVIISDPALRKTPNIMTKFEYARIIGERATEIENGTGAPLKEEIIQLARDLGIPEDTIQKSINVAIDPRVVFKAEQMGLDVALDVAELELEMKEVDFPMVIERLIKPGVYELWKVRELQTPTSLLYSNYYFEKDYDSPFVEELKPIPSTTLKKFVKSKQRADELVRDNDFKTPFEISNTNISIIHKFSED